MSRVKSLSTLIVAVGFAWQPWARHRHAGARRLRRGRQTDLAVFRSSTGMWWILQVEDQLHDRRGGSPPIRRSIIGQEDRHYTPESLAAYARRTKEPRAVGRRL